MSSGEDEKEGFKWKYPGLRFFEKYTESVLQTGQVRRPSRIFESQSVSQTPQQQPQTPQSKGPFGILPKGPIRSFLEGFSKPTGTSAVSASQQATEAVAPRPAVATRAITTYEDFVSLLPCESSLTDNQKQLAYKYASHLSATLGVPLERIKPDAVCRWIQGWSSAFITPSSPDSILILEDITAQIVKEIVAGY
ncbi:MAG: hypothetical protein QW453_03195 [Thermoprotei archaeon]